MSASLGLFRLQQVDRKIDRARSQLETIRKTLENDTELRECLTCVSMSNLVYSFGFAFSPARPASTNPSSSATTMNRPEMLEVMGRDPCLGP